MSTLKEQHDNLLSQLGDRKLQAEIQEMESLLGLHEKSTHSLWSEVPTRRQLTESDDSDSVGWNRMPQLRRRNLGATRQQNFTSIYDRADGRFLPYYDNELDLDRTRIQCRNVAKWAATAVGIGKTLDAYVINSGFSVDCDYKYGVKEEPNLLAAVKQALDIIHRNNPELLDVECQRELHNESRIDGEKLIAIFPDHNANSVNIQFIDATEIREPLLPSPLNNMLGLDDDGPYKAFWEFGVLTIGNPNLRLNGPKDVPINDLSKPLGYHVCYDDGGLSWDYIPAENAVHVKRNVTDKAKRGWSDYAIILETMEREIKLTRNLAEGAAIQSAIAFIRERAPGQLIQNSISGGDITTVTKSSTQSGKAFSTQKQTFHPGTIPDVGNGYKFHYGPMGQPNSGVFQDVAKYLERIGGKLWVIPSFMITGDTETALFNAVLAIGSPFVNARQMDQTFYGNALKETYIKSLDVMIQHGWFPLDVSLDEILDSIEVTVHGADITIEDSKSRAERHTIELQNGTLSIQTATEESGKDFEVEQQRIEEQGGIPDNRPTLGTALDSFASAGM